MIDDLLIKAPLLTAVDEVLGFVIKNTSLAYSFDGNRSRLERWQFPLEAIRELTLNAIVHRDYRHPSDVVIKIFDDKIIFTNPGGLFGKLTLADLERNDYISYLRNRLLAEAFYLTGDIEKYGTGFIRVREALCDYPEIALTIGIDGDFFRVELKTITPTIDGYKGDKLSGLERRILEIISESPDSSYSSIAERLKISRNTVIEYMGRVKKKGMFKSIGSTRTGSWQLADLTIHLLKDLSGF